MAAQSPHDTFYLFATGREEALMNLPAYTEPNIVVVTLPVPNKLANALWLVPGGPSMDRFLPEPPDVWLFPSAHIQNTKAPSVVLFHDATLRTVPECFTLKDHLRAWAANEERIFHRAHHVIAVSEHSKRDAITYYGLPEERVSVATLGVDHAVFLPREQSSDRSYRAAYDLNRPYLLWLATREPRKNVDGIIHAYTLARERGISPLPLVLAGADGWKTRHITDALAASPYRNDIRELSYVPEKHKAALYRGATTFLFPSLYEGFGLPVLEAMACGAPVITSISSSLPEVTGDAALLVDPLNITAIAQALEVVLDPNHGDCTRAVLRNRGIARAAQFSWNRAAALVLQALHSAV